jgi:CDP-glycerol glycerophosphotransferase (TagB/SpsB family)
MAVLRRPVVYYQFDEDEAFAGVATYAPGHFDYRQEGFGPVCATEDEVVTSIRELLPHAGVPSPMYSARMEAAIRYRDGQNCRRVFDRILELESAAPAKRRPDSPGSDHVSLAAE